MHAFVLLFGLLWAEAAPLTIVPGMPLEQVEATLGKAHVITFSGPIPGGSLSMTYLQWRLTVCSTDGKVGTVIRHKK